MLIERDRTALLVVDIQERLLPHIHEGQAVLDNAVWLVKVAQRLGVPVMLSEQYPKGIGHTVAVLRELTLPAHVAEKLHFSCVAAQCLDGLQGSERPQVVVAGTESHVCVLQTVLDLHAQGKEVYVVADAVGSRRPSDKELALARMRGHGVRIVSREMVAFEWLKQAGTEEFRQVSREFLK
ncbi:MAG: hydrolase [Betaproteobacteria bacterium HGW-Betaproteobacteria-14]|nr:MAG: hydrolase [Betaproteobacteria bacterium HGW-Betaproteobacteria-14]